MDQIGMDPSPWQRVAAHVALSFVMITFSAWNVLAESIDGGVASALLVGALRDITSLICLTVVSLLRLYCRKRSHAAGDSPASCGTSEESRGWSAPRSLREWLLVAGVGVTGPFLAAAAGILCSKLCSGDMNGILNALTPAVTGVLATAFGIDRPSWNLALAVLLGTASGIVAVDSPTSSAEQSRPAAQLTVGILAGLLAVLSQASYFVFTRFAQLSRQGSPPLDALSLITHSYFFAAPASVAAYLVASGTSTSGFPSWEGQEVLLAAYAGVVCGALNFALITWACQYVRVSVCALYGVVQPPCTALIAFVAKGEALKTAGLLSGALALASLLCATAGPGLSAARRLSGDMGRALRLGAGEEGDCGGPLRA